MCIAKTKINFKLIITISIGAVTGGIFGTKIFELLLNRFDNERLKGIQGLILGVFLVVSVIYINLKNAKSLNIKNPIAVVAVGFALGSIASFLGVGGGPINVPPMSNEIITLVKDTSLARTIAIVEIIRVGEDYITGAALFWPLFYTAVFYLVFCGILTLLFGAIEKKMSYFNS